MTRPRTTAWLRFMFSDSAYGALLMRQAMMTRKSRKRKEYLRAIIRLSNQRPEDDYLFFCGQVAREFIHFKKAR